MKTSRLAAMTLLATLAACAFSQSAHAHGFVGDRFFPPTISSDDPLASDELSFPAFSYFQNPTDPGDPDQKEADIGFSFSKLIVPHFALELSETYTFLKTDGTPTNKGWSNLELNAKYEVYQNEDHEFIFSAGLSTEFGGSGSTNIGAESFTTFAPTMYFGKGLGDLPDSVGFLRPLAVTGTFDVTFPTSRRADSAEIGVAIEYSIPYLQQHVVDVGIPAPFKDMIPVVEFATSTDINGDGSGRFTGTINPGVLWETRYFQLGVEAIVPMNSDSGAHVGAMVNVNIFIDDIFPKVFGFPIFGGQ